MVIQRIHHHYENLSEELQRAAKWITEHPSEACILTMRDQARKANVVGPAMARLAKALGFISFPAMQEQLRASLSSEKADPALPVSSSPEPASPILAHQELLTSLQTESLNCLHGINTPGSLTRVAQFLLQAKTTAYLGLRSSHSIALHAHYLHQMLLGHGVLLDDRYGMLTELMDEFEDRTILVAISLAPYSRRIIEIAEHAVERGIPIIALTDSHLSPLIRISQESLFFQASSNTVFHSLVAAHALVEQIMAEVAAQGGESIMQHIRKREEALEISGAYWSESVRTTHP